MYREAFVRELAVAKVKENDRNYFPRWFARYARLQDCSTVDVPISVERVIAFCRVLLTSKTPAWQRLQAVRAIECYRNLVQKTSEPDLSSIRKKRTELASRERNSGGLSDEPHVVGFIDPGEIEIVQEFRRWLRLSGKAMRTERAYVKWIKQFLGFCETSEAAHLNENDIRRFLTKKSVNDQCSPGTLRQCRSALLFLFQQVLGRELEFIPFSTGSRQARVPNLQCSPLLEVVELESRRLSHQLSFASSFTLSTTRSRLPLSS